MFLPLLLRVTAPPADAVVEERALQRRVERSKRIGLQPLWHISRKAIISRFYFALEKSSTAKSCPPRSTTPTPIESISESSIFAR